MKYNNTQTAVFLSRPNRFIAEVLINDKTEIVHVKNTGRCKELLVNGATVILEKSDNPNRTTQYDL
ncbi:MAG: DNA/RNA nuclease SfsA, partial [Oscillospiraceae bacterium]|nr:DNA/RNA nuclease SfsA [Oscillospiraceae bacterium]